MTPNKTWLIKGSSKFGSKIKKERITVLLGSNCDGSDKIKPLIIGKAANPRCFFKTIVVGTSKKKKRVKLSLPIDYESNASGWVTEKFWKSYMQKLTARMKREK